MLIEAVVDPNEPPMPPRVSFEDMKKFSEALAKGTLHRGDIIRTIFKDKVRELV